MLLDVLLGDKANTTLPAGRGVVEDVDNLEFLLVDVMELLEIVAEENVLFVDVGVDEGDGGAVEGVAEGHADDGDHGRDTGAAGDHAEVLDDVGGIEEVALGALDLELVANLEVANVLGDVALLVSLEKGRIFVT